MLSGAGCAPLSFLARKRKKLSRYIHSSLVTFCISRCPRQRLQRCRADSRLLRQRGDMEATAAKNDEPCAYAKLWGQLDGVPFHCYVTALPSTLGRGSAQTEGARKPAGFIDLGRSKALSREHGERDSLVCQATAVKMKEFHTF